LVSNYYPIERNQASSFLVNSIQRLYWIFGDNDLIATKTLLNFTCTVLTYYQLVIVIVLL